MSKATFLGIALFALAAGIILFRSNTPAVTPTVTPEHDTETLQQLDNEIVRNNGEVAPGASTAPEEVGKPASRYPEVGEVLIVGGRTIVSTGGPENWAPWLEQDEQLVKEERQESVAADLPAVATNPEALFELVPELAPGYNEDQSHSLTDLHTDPETGETIPVEVVNTQSLPRARPYFEPDDEAAKNPSAEPQNPEGIQPE